MYIMLSENPDREGDIICDEGAYRALRRIWNGVDVENRERASTFGTLEAFNNIQYHIGRGHEWVYGIIHFDWRGTGHLEEMKRCLREQGYIIEAIPPDTPEFDIERALAAALSHRLVDIKRFIMGGQ